MADRKKSRSVAPAEPISDALRQAIMESGVSRYAIAQATGVSESVLSRFVNRERDTIQLTTADALARFLSLELRPVPPRKSRP